MRRAWWWGTGVVLLLVVLFLAVTYPRIRKAAQVGTGYVALQMCACTEVSSRPFDACLLDMLPGMERVQAERVVREGSRGVRAWVPLYSESVAVRMPPDACTLIVVD